MTYANITATYTAAECNAAVSRGIAWAKARDPAALREICLSGFSIESSHLCVLGQRADYLLPAYYRAGRDNKALVFGYDDVAGYYAGQEGIDSKSAWAAHYGFFAPFAFNHDRYETRERWIMLQCAWQSAIALEQEIAAAEANQQVEAKAPVHA